MQEGSKEVTKEESQVERKKERKKLSKEEICVERNKVSKESRQEGIKEGKYVGRK